MEVDRIKDKHILLLKQGIEALHLNIDTIKLSQLIKYVELLLKWNKYYSLTAITDVERIIVYHLLDALAIIPYLDSAQTIIDVGSGMGIPGVVIAICYPQKQVWLVDSNHKKTTFLQQVAIELVLPHLVVKCSKIESVISPDCYDVAISRAFSSSRLLIEKLAHLKVTTVMLMKSINVINEIDEINGYTYSLAEVRLPGSDNKRYLLKIDLKCTKI